MFYSTPPASVSQNTYSPTQHLPSLKRPKTSQKFLPGSCRHICRFYKALAFYSPIFDTSKPPISPALCQLSRPNSTAPPPPQPPPPPKPKSLPTLSKSFFSPAPPYNFTRDIVSHDISSLF